MQRISFQRTTWARYCAPRCGVSIAFAAALISAAAIARAADTAPPADMRAVCEACVLEKIAQCDALLEAPAFDRNSVLWVAAPRKGALYTIDRNGRCTEALKLPRERAIPAGLRFLPDGSMLGVDVLNGTFHVDAAHVSATYLEDRFRPKGLEGAIFKGLDDLVLDEVGGAYITDAMGSGVLNPVGQVFYRAPNGEFSKVIAGGLAFPDGIALSPDGKTLYVGEWRAARILAVPVVGPGRLDLDRSDVFAYSDGGRGPDGLALDEQGNLYAADWGAGGRVSVYGRGGGLLGYIRLPDHAIFEPTNLAFNNGFLYVVDLAGGVWRVRIKIPGLRLYGDR